MSATGIELGIGPGNEPDIESGGGLPLLAGERWLPASSRDRRFVIALGATAVLHAVFVIGIARSVPRYAGDPSGANNAISIAIVTEADLKSLSTVPETGDRPPGAPANAVPPPQPPEPQSKPDQPQPDQPEPDQPETLRQSITEDVPEVPDTKSTSEPGPTQGPTPEPTPAPKKPIAKAQPQLPPKPKQSAKLDLTPPATSFNAPEGGGGKSAGFERPPGITRSGANDEFARNVIRELKKTMPQLSSTFGRVKVRIVLNQNGNVIDVQVMMPSNVAGLDQSVVFAVKQTSFPFPPPNSLPVDRIFQVTYIYH